MSDVVENVPAAATGSVRRSRDVPMLVERARAGDPRAVARLITLVESGDEVLPQVAAALAPYAGQAQVVGLTGSPGWASRPPPTSWSGRCGRAATGSACWPSTRPARSPAARSSATGSGCRTTPPTRASTSARCPAAVTSAGCRRRRRRRSGCWRAPAATWCWWRPSASGRPRWRSPRWRTPHWCCSPRAWATRSRRSRPASWRSPTSSWSTRPTGTAPTPPSATSRA